MNADLRGHTPPGEFGGYFSGFRVKNDPMRGAPDKLDRGSGS
jgi:hypothetical protein